MRIQNMSEGTIHLGCFDYIVPPPSPNTRYKGNFPKKATLNPSNTPQMTLGSNRTTRNTSEPAQGEDGTDIQYTYRNFFYCCFWVVGG